MARRAPACQHRLHPPPFSGSVSADSCQLVESVGGLKDTFHMGKHLSSFVHTSDLSSIAPPRPCFIALSLSRPLGIHFPLFASFWRKMLPVPRSGHFAEPGPLRTESLHALNRQLALDPLSRIARRSAKRFGFLEILRSNMSGHRGDES